MDEGLRDLFDVVMDVLPGLIIVLVIASIVFGFTRTGLFGAIFGSNSKRRSAPGVGIVRSKRQTGVYINENPQFEIEVDLVRADGSVVRATLRQVVPLDEMHLVDEGVALPVRYDPEDPTDVALADDVDPALAQDIAARHRARTHPTCRSSCTAASPPRASSAGCAWTSCASPGAWRVATTRPA